MQKFSVGMLVEGLFVGIAVLLLWLVFQDKRSGEPWSTKELFLFGCGLGMAVMGAAVEVAMG